MAVIVLIYLLFLSIGTQALLQTKFFSLHRKVSLIFLGAIIIMQAPFLLWGFYGQIRPVEYPGDWQVVNSELKCGSGERVLFLPWHLYQSFGWVGQIISNPAKTFFACPIISSSASEWGECSGFRVERTLP